MAASPESNLIADIVKQAPGLGNIDHLAQEASYLLGVRDFRTNPEMRDGILGALGNEEDLLKTLVWAERTRLDVDGDQIIEVGEANQLIMEDDIFLQLAAHLMSSGTRDVSFSELNEAAKATAERNGIAYVGDAPVSATLAAGDPAEANVMQFSGEQSGDLLSQGSQDPVARYKDEAQYLGMNFGSLDADSNGLVDDAEFKAAISGSDITRLTAASIALEHNLVTIENDQISNLTIDHIARDFHAGPLQPEGGEQLTDSGMPAYVPEGTETEGGMYQFTGNQNAGEHPAYASEEHPAYAPDESSEDPNQSEDMRTLNSKNASTKDRLKAIARLVEAGKTSATITDSDGSKFDVRMEVVPVAGSSRTMVHMFATDPQTGKEFVVLRAIKDGEDFTRQRDESGNEVDFSGTRWRQNHPDSMFLQ